MYPPAYPDIDDSIFWIIFKGNFQDVANDCTKNALVHWSTRNIKSASGHYNIQIFLNKIYS